MMKCISQSRGFALAFATVFFVCCSVRFALGRNLTAREIAFVATGNVIGMTIALGPYMCTDQ